MIGILSWIAGVFLFAMLATLQFVSMSAFHDVAQAQAPMHLLTPTLAARAGDGNFPLATFPLHLALARNALAAGDDVRAEHWIERLPEGSDRLDLAGLLAERRGDIVTAARDDIRSGDRESLLRALSALEHGGNLVAAIALVREEIGQGERRMTEPDTLAEAFWQLGLLLQERFVQSGGRVRADALDALQADQQALKLGPYSMKYLLAVGYQALVVGKADLATEYFERALRAYPRNAEAFAGLGRAALARDDRETARAEYRRAWELDPKLDAVRSLGSLVGP
ncbi:MAG TPA: tetratricopeptide repeat protein [Candidatus Baltobacteraceae bacterium]|nr:tetratricopeptide repeat protein [Candidatus Baltobacteraceae bacterium]